MEQLMLDFITVVSIYLPKKPFHLKKQATELQRKQR